MSLVHDPISGWVTFEGEPRWISTETALKRVSGAEIKWTDGPHKTQVASLVTDNKVISVIRYYPNHRRYSVKIEGFLFWGYNSILGYNMFKSITQFTSAGAAKKFVRTVLSQAGAIV